MPTFASLVSRSVDEAAVGAWIQIDTLSDRTSNESNVHFVHSIFVPQGLASPQLLPNKLQISALQPDLPGQNFSDFSCSVSYVM